MKVLLQCPKCRQRYSARPRQVGHRFSCHRCGSRLFITQPRHKLKGMAVASAGIVPPVERDQLIWRNDSMIVAGPDAHFPRHCVFCDRRTERRLKKTFSFSTPFTGGFYYAAMALGLLARNTFSVRESITVHLSVCDGCWLARMHKIIWQASLGIAFLLLPMVLLCLLEYFQFNLNGLSRSKVLEFAFVSPFVIGLYLCRLALEQEDMLQVARIGEVRWTPEFDGSEYFIWLTGASATFLWRLPGWDMELEVQDYRKRGSPWRTKARLTQPAQGR